MFTPINFKNPNTRNLRSTSLLNRNNSHSEDREINETDSTDFTTVLQEKISESKTQINPVNQSKAAIPTDHLNELAGLVGELEQLGDGLSKLPSLDNFFSYRRVLQKILQKAIPQALEIQKDYSLNTENLSQKEYHLIKKVNEEVNSLLELIESGHKNNFIIANKVVSIKGLIIDFYS